MRQLTAAIAVRVRPKDNTKRVLGLLEELGVVQWRSIAKNRRRSVMARALKFAAVLFLANAITPPASAERVFDRIKVDAGESLFVAECRRCHVANSTDPSYGPTLDGVIGRLAGSVEGYEYSEALAGSGIVWTKAALRAWMEDNKGFMPGTKMRHIGITDRTVQDFILAYLASLSQ